VGVLFTLWSGFGQYRALTHGSGRHRQVRRHDDPGAINHFQALSAALSATVGLGNIAGVAPRRRAGRARRRLLDVDHRAVRHGDQDDRGHPVHALPQHRRPGEPARRADVRRGEGFKECGLGPLGSFIGGIFVVTLLISAITGGNMFQAWNVGDITFNYFQIPQVATGIVLAVAGGAGDHRRHQADRRGRGPDRAVHVRLYVLAALLSCS
jgi:AGCS family alanine or glycine:cation symporter